MRPGTLLFFCALATTSVAACAASTDDAATEADDVSAADAAVIALGAASQQTLFVRFPEKPSKELTDAVIAAAKRGVDTRAVLSRSDEAFDSTWMLQQRLESSGVDVDVRSDEVLEDVVAASDDAALLRVSSRTKKVTGAPAAAAAKRFTDVMDGKMPPAGRLAARNTVTLHPMPESSRDRIVALFGAATRSIDVEIYQLQDRVVVKALAAAAARNVKVRVMLEPKTVGSENYKAVSKELAAAGVEVQTTPPAFDSSRNVDHAKLAVIDDAELVFGTGNLVRSGLGGASEGPYNNRDFWVEDTRAANVKAGRALFDADWARRTTKVADFDAFVLTPDNAEHKISDLVDAAHRRLFVYNQSLDDDVLVAKLIDAKRRGADVRVLLGYQPGFGGQPPKNQEPIDKLRAAGVRADFLKKHYLHAKAIVSDDRAYVGSQNFTNGGLRNNRELGEIFDDSGVVAKLVETFESDSR
jgi:phosphatidylserine/phosphatidylglycerophosphate/cardiolipin synthase-like enzyme